MRSDDDLSRYDRPNLEMLASGTTSAGGAVDPALFGRAKAELIRRDREYATEQEQSRRQFEIGLFNAESDRDTKRKQFETALADRQMNHDAALAEKQLAALKT